MSSPIVESRQSVQDSSSIEKKGSHRVEREQDKENGRMEQRQNVRPDGDNAVVGSHARDERNWRFRGTVGKLGKLSGQ